MRYEIYKDEEFVNAIEASEDFINKYCSDNGYTYTACPHPEPEPEKPTSDTSVWDELDAAYQEGVDSV